MLYHIQVLFLGLMQALGFGAVMMKGSEKEDLVRHTFRSIHMGTEFRIVLYHHDSSQAKKAADAAFTRVKQLDKIMSDYDAESELMRLCHRNDRQPGKEVTISAELYEVLTTAQKISQESDGMFDVTVGPIVKLWRLARKSRILPDVEARNKALEKVGYEKIVLHENTSSVSLKVPGMRLDLGGIAKGYAADQALKILEKAGVKRALIAASGDIRVGDPPPGKEYWTVEIAALTPKEKPRYLKLKNAAVSTSGDLFQFIEISGVRYSHVLNPKTGLGLTGRRSSTVVAPLGLYADALTKTVSLLPREKAEKILQKYQAEMFTAVRDPESAKPVYQQSQGFSKFLIEAE